MTRHQQPCDCDACYAARVREALRRTGHFDCLGQCGRMLPKDHDGDYCEACRLESGEARWCECGNEVIAKDGECTQVAP